MHSAHENSEGTYPAVYHLFVFPITMISTSPNYYPTELGKLQCLCIVAFDAKIPASLPIGSVSSGYLT